jgi:hypothetical protein
VGGGLLVGSGFDRASKIREGVGHSLGDGTRAVAAEVLVDFFEAASSAWMCFSSSPVT